MIEKIRERYGKKMKSEAVERELKQYFVDCLAECGAFIGRAIETYPAMELFEVYLIYTERHDLIEAIPDIREQIETGNYDEKVCDFLQRNKIDPTD